jgi:hypothetical protein
MIKINRKAAALTAMAAAACIGLAAGGLGVASAATAPVVHHAAFFSCISHNGAGTGTPVTGRPVSCPAGSILAEGDHGTTGPAGPKGTTGAQGPAGPAGKDGTAGDILHNSSAPVTIPAGGEAQAYATCAADPVHGLAPNGTADGYVAVGGGWSTDNGSGTSGGKVTVSMSRDELTNTGGKGWLVTAYNGDTASHTVYAWVICVSAPADQADT